MPRLAMTIALTFLFSGVPLRASAAPKGAAVQKPVKTLIRADCEIDTLRRQAFKEGMRTLRLSGAEKVGAGLTTISEVLRVSPVSDS